MLSDALESPKFADLQEQLGLSRWEAVGVLESLWLFTRKSAKRGDIGRWTNRQIARGLDWDRDPEELVVALFRAGWIDACADHRLVVHDWPDHADKSLRATLKNQSIDFAQLRAPEDPAAAEKLVVGASTARTGPPIHDSSQDRESETKNRDPDPENRDPVLGTGAPPGPGPGPEPGPGPGPVCAPERAPARANQARKAPAPERLSEEAREKVRSWAERKEPWALARMVELEEACLGHFRANGQRFVDWGLVLENWIRNERTRYGTTPRSPPTQRGQQQRPTQSAIREEDRHKREEITF